MRSQTNLVSESLEKSVIMTTNTCSICLESRQTTINMSKIYLFAQLQSKRLVLPKKMLRANWYETEKFDSKNVESKTFRADFLGLYRF